MLKKRQRFSFKGWFSDTSGKPWFFRSLKELSFAIHLNKLGTPWRGAETVDLTVDYVDLYGKKRKHYADFFLENKIIVEVKPLRYQRGKLVQLKAAAMKDFCEKNNYIYMMVSPRKINIADLQELIKEEKVLFTDDTKNKIPVYISKRGRNHRI